jgi:hypothetical protein
MPSRSIDPWHHVSVLARKPGSEGSLHEERAKAIERGASVHLKE